MPVTGHPLPLSGLRVLDLTTVIFGPYATQILGDFGADVIKIEAPEGDLTRDIGPTKHPKMASLYLGSNRNKRSVVLDLKRDAAKTALWKLIEDADVFVHNIRPQKIAKLGFDADAVLEKNPAIVYGGLHGYGEAGPYGGQPAYDDVIQGQSGLAGTFWARDGAPVMVPTIAADKTAGLMAVGGLLAGVIRRLVTGKGIYVETAMFEGLASYVLLEHQHGAIYAPPETGFGYPRALSPARRPHPTADGHIAMLAYTDGQWRRFWDLIGRPELAEDPRFVTMAERARNIDALYGIAADVLASKPTAEWLELLKTAEIAAGPVNRIEDLHTDPHLSAVGFFRQHAHPTEGDLEAAGSGIRFDRETPPIRQHQPGLGEHGREVLAEAGLSEVEIEAALSDG